MDRGGRSLKPPCQNSQVTLGRCWWLTGQGPDVFRVYWAKPSLVLAAVSWYLLPGHRVKTSQASISRGHACPWCHPRLPQLRMQAHGGRVIAPFTTWHIEGAPSIAACRGREVLSQPPHGTGRGALAGASALKMGSMSSCRKFCLDKAKGPSQGCLKSSPRVGRSSPRAFRRHHQTHPPLRKLPSVPKPPLCRFPGVTVLWFPAVEATSLPNGP